QDVLIALSGSSQTSPAFWVSPQNGVEYPLAVQTPQYREASVNEVMNTPVSAHASTANAPLQLVSNLVQLKPHDGPALVTHYNIRPVIDV
ncbi:hypothetical protein SB748_32525, partial [Rhizobium sp. SIMBA_035]